MLGPTVIVAVLLTLVMPDHSSRCDISIIGNGEDRG